MKRSLGLLLVLAAACGKSDSEKFADAYCPEIAKCCGQAGLPADGKPCYQLVAFAASRGWYNATAGDACLAEIRSWVSAGTFCTNLDSSPSTCNALFSTSPGSGKPGATCVQTDDCALSTEGQVTCAGAAGDGYVFKCQVQIRGKVGDSPCVGTQDGTSFYSTTNATDVLAKAYVCNVSDGLRCANGACVALADLNESCNSPSDCVRSAYCDSSKSQCVARMTAGGTCTGVDNYECEDGYYCPSSGTKQCTARLAKAASCSSNAMCQSDICLNGACESASEPLTLYCGS